jgi:hypothetical protein
MKTILRREVKTMSGFAGESLLHLFDSSILQLAVETGKSLISAAPRSVAKLTLGWTATY